MFIQVFFFFQDESSLLEKDRGLGNMFRQGMPFPRNFNLLSGRGCPHCKLIDSGDVAMYGVTCPECGEVPPSKKHLYPNLSANVRMCHKCNKCPKQAKVIYEFLFLKKELSRFSI